MQGRLRFALIFLLPLQITSAASPVAHAIERGMDFLESVAADPQYSASYGDDLMWCFYSIARTSADPELRARANSAGVTLAGRWRAAHRTLPADARPPDIAEIAFGSYAADRLGFPNRALKAQLRAAAARFPTEAFLAFDPRQGPPQSTPARSRYDIYCDALVASYTGDRYGVTLGAPWSDVIKWLPGMRPYTARPRDPEFYDTLYAVTHVVYTFNDYSLRAVNPSCLRPEFDFLRTNLPGAIALRDPETLGEFMDTLRSFGVAATDLTFHQAIDYLLAAQNADGSWGNLADPDIYNRYHATWTAVDGLREYRFRKARSCPNN